MKVRKNRVQIAGHEKKKNNVNDIKRRIENGVVRVTNEPSLKNDREEPARFQGAICAQHWLLGHHNEELATFHRRSLPGAPLRLRVSCKRRFLRMWHSRAA